MAGTFTPTPGSISNLSLLELEQLEKADFSAGSKALTQGYAGTGGFSINAEPYFTGPEMITREVLPSTVSLTPGPYLNTGAHDFTVWMGPTILYEGTTGNASGVDKWYDSDSGLDFTAMGIVAGDLVLVKDTHQPTHENANIVGVISGIATHELTLSAQSAALTINSDHYIYLIAHPSASQLFAVPGSGPLGQEQTFLSVAPGASIHNVPAPSLDDINLVRYPYLIPPYMSGSTVRDRADSVFGSPAPLTSLDSLGYRLILYPDDGAGAPDLAHPISALNPVIDPAVPSAEQRMTIDYRTGVIRFSCPPVPVTGDLNPAGYVNPITGRMNLYAVFWTYDLSNGPLDTVSALYVPLSTSLDFHDPARIYYDSVTSQSWRVLGDIQFDGTVKPFTATSITSNGKVTINAGGLSTAPSIIGTTLAHQSVGVGGAYYAWDPNTQAPYLLLSVSNDGETPNLTLSSGTSVGQRITVRFNQTRNPSTLKGRSGLIWKGSYTPKDILLLTPAIGFGVSTAWELVWDLGFWTVASKVVSYYPGDGNTFKGISPPVDYLNFARNLTQRTGIFGAGPDQVFRFFYGRIGGGYSVWFAIRMMDEPSQSIRYSLDDGRSWASTDVSTFPGISLGSAVAAYDDPSNCLMMCVSGGTNHVWASTDAIVWDDTSTGRLNHNQPSVMGYLGIDGSGDGVFVVGQAGTVDVVEKSSDAGGTWTVVHTTGGVSQIVGFASNLHTGVAMAWFISGATILVTTDRGDNWTEVTPSNPFHNIQSIVYLPGCGTWVAEDLVGGGNSVFFNSVDDGATWTAVSPTLTMTDKLQVFGPSLLVGTRLGANTGAYFVSADAGATWMAMDGGAAWDVGADVPAKDIATSSVYGSFSELLIWHDDTASLAVSQRVTETNEQYG